MEEVMFEEWSIEQVEKEAESFLARTRRFKSSISKHDFKILFSSYLIDNMLRGYIENGQVHFRGVPDPDMIEEAVEKIWR